MDSELRKTGISVVGDMPWGTHFCTFYDTKQDLLDILVPYFKTGLENNEFCLWIISNSELITPDEAKEALGAAAPDLDQYLAEGRIEIVSHDEWFLENGAFDLHRVAYGFKKKLDEALANGYAGLRLNGSPAWIQAEDPNVLREFEGEADHSFADEHIIASCSYPVVESRADFLLDVARNHQFAIARRQGSWDVLETPQLIQAKQEIKKLIEELEQRVAERTKELASANEELRKEIAERKQAEDDLRKHNEVLKTIMDNIPLMIRFLGPDARVQLVNRTWERTLGWSLEEVQQRNIGLLDELYPDPQERQRALDFVAAATGEWADFRIHARDGRVIDATFANIRLSDGTNISIGQDITDRKRAEDTLRTTTEQLRALSASLRSAREDEGTRIAREIHDELGSALTSLRWDLESLDKIISESTDESGRSVLRGKIEDMLSLTESAVGAVRRISSELRPTVLDDLGLAAAIEWQAEQFQVRTGIVCRCDCSLDDLDLSQEKSTAVFRIFQETLTNILRHAQATSVEIAIKAEGGEFILTISDNGRGITEDEKTGSRSLGILGMQERAHLIGAAIIISGTAAKGTVITLRVPLAADAE